MQKRIYLNFVLLILFCILLLAGSFSLLFWNTARNREMATIRTQAHLMDGLRTYNFYETTRITIIDINGVVMSDTHGATGSRANREEVLQAQLYGSGEAVRHSSTLGGATFYYAVRLNDGSILRISRPLNTLGEVFTTILPVLVAITAAVLVFAHLVARHLNRKIIEPEIARQLTVQQKAEQQRREFSANVSHELKTPLTTITALSDMMANGMVNPEDYAPFATRIQTQTKRLIGIIDEIIYLSEFDENKVERNFAQFDLYDLAQSVIDNLQDKAIEKSVTITLEGYPVNINANIGLVDEMLHNLIDNAIKYNTENGTVTVSISQEDDKCKIAVTDTGIGIPEHHHARIFERFYRVDKSRSKATGGTGLGLAIVKHIVEHHNGKITLESEENKGTTIYVAW
ncbi:MAG: ATP-binding protein [Defluviitaleaceae bacterium]|nr:ATP-binding protein [Defluviitaleaceae bacterium]